MILEGIPLAFKIVAAMGTLVLGVLLVYYGLLLRDRLFPTARPVPMLEIWKMAYKYGWAFEVELNLHVLDFILAFQQSGLRGELVFEGRANTSGGEFITRNEPLQQIEESYWKDHIVEFSGIFAGDDGTSKNFVTDNYYCFSKHKKSTVRDQEKYYDLHVSGATPQWFKKVASMFIDRRVKQLEASKHQAKSAQEKNKEGENNYDYPIQ